VKDESIWQSSLAVQDREELFSCTCPVNAILDRFVRLDLFSPVKETWDGEPYT